MQNNKDKLLQKKKAAETVAKYANTPAYSTVSKIEGAKINNTPEIITENDKKNCIIGSIKMVLDGVMTKQAQKAFQESGFDTENLRRSIVEPTVHNWARRVSATGALDEVVEMAKMIGEETPEEEIPAGAKKIIRERVTIEIKD